MLKSKQIINIINTILNIFSKKKMYLTLLNHNGIDIDDYPETEWYLVPFPKQKGEPYNSDNLATVNRYKFIENKQFIETLKISENRWSLNSTDEIRNISWRLHVMLWSVSLALKEVDIENEIFIECGTGRGYMAAGICSYFKWDANKPNFYLIDSFKSTMPESDGSQVESGKKLFVYADGDNEVRSYFEKYNNIKILTGMIPEILNEIPDIKHIKFLHLDLNNANAELSALLILKSRFTKGTIILFDDYGGYGGEDQAIVHEQIAQELNRQLLILPTGQALLII
jgi:O-methyltransferase